MDEKKKRFVVEVSMTIPMVVFAESHVEAADNVPANTHAESVRLESDSYEDRLTVINWCAFCCQPILSDADGKLYTGVSVPAEKFPDLIDIPFGDDVCCRKCAIEKGLVSA